MTISIDTFIIIDAPKSAVWETLMNFTSYPEWNPLIPRIQGGTDIGATLKATLKINRAQLPLRVKVSQHKAIEVFAWAGGVAGIFSGEHVFQLRDTEDGKTRLDHYEDFNGALAHGVLRGAFYRTIEKNYRAFNQALKQRVETQITP